MFLSYQYDDLKTLESAVMSFGLTQNVIVELTPLNHIVIPGTLHRCNPQNKIHFAPILTIYICAVYNMAVPFCFA